MQSPLFINFLLWVVVSTGAYAQYTETINTNRPGSSQGAFAVGKNVIQFETGLVFGKQKHTVFDNETRTSEFQYNVRIGLIKEQLEFGIQGSYLNLKSTDRLGNSDGIVRRGFPFNALGVKYLIYDPYKYAKEDKKNILSWDANKKFKWKKLIPAVSAYAAAGFTSSSGDFAFQNNPDARAKEIQSNIAPKFVISAHNVWSEKLVFIVNIISRNLGTEFPEYGFIGTTTYNYNKHWSFFGEYEAVSSKVYKDHLLKAGGAFLATPDLQFDARILGNFKDTPSIFNFALGASYRLDYHKSTDNEYIDTAENHGVKKYIELIKKDIESGHLDESVLEGELQSVLENDVIVERFKGVDLQTFLQEEEQEEEFEGEFPEDIEEDDTRIKWWQIGKRRRLRRKAMSDTVSVKPLAGSGARRSGFLDDEFIKKKQAEITPKERTAEELAELELRREAENKKKKRFGKSNRANEVYVDKITGDSIPPPDYSGMSRKERKIAEKQHRDLFELDDLGINDLKLDEFAEQIESEQNSRDNEKERKRKEKEARKLAKRKAKQKKKQVVSEEKLGELPSIKKEDVQEEKVDDDFDIEKALEQDKELQKLEAEIAREEEKERKRKEKEEEKALKAKLKKEKAEAKKNKKSKSKEVEEEF